MLIKASKYFLFLVLLSFYFSACKKETKVIKQTEVSFKKEGELSIFNATGDSLKVTLDIEIADTEYDTQTGLMYRSGMETKQGMLFVFKDESQRSFYMKNTKIPLDILYINANKRIVSTQKNTKPFDETSLPSNKPAKYVLEINAGLFDIWNLKEGDSIDF